MLGGVSKCGCLVQRPLHAAPSGAKQRQWLRRVTEQYILKHPICIETTIVPRIRTEPLCLSEKVCILYIIFYSRC